MTWFVFSDCLCTLCFILVMSSKITHAVSLIHLFKKSSNSKTENCTPTYIYRQYNIWPRRHQCKVHPFKKCVITSTDDLCGRHHAVLTGWESGSQVQADRARPGIWKAWSLYESEGMMGHAIKTSSLASCCTGLSSHLLLVAIFGHSLHFQPQLFLLDLISLPVVPLPFASLPVLLHLFLAPRSLQWTCKPQCCSWLL